MKRRDFFKQLAIAPVAMATTVDGKINRQGSLVKAGDALKDFDNHTFVGIAGHDIQKGEMIFKCVAPQSDQ